MSLQRKITKKNKKIDNLTLFIGGTAIIITISAGILAGLNSSKTNANYTSSIRNINIFGNIEKMNFKDGKYIAEGKYNSPEGTVSIDLTIDIKDNKIESVEVIPKVGLISGSYQEMFGKDISRVVKGKPLDAPFDLSQVNGSSLTGIGFRNAVEDIKRQAK